MKQDGLGLQSECASASVGRDSLECAVGIRNCNPRACKSAPITAPETISHAQEIVPMHMLNCHGHAHLLVEQGGAAHRAQLFTLNGETADDTCRALHGSS